MKGDTYYRFVTTHMLAEVTVCYGTSKDEYVPEKDEKANNRRSKSPGSVPGDGGRCPCQEEGT